MEEITEGGIFKMPENMKSVMIFEPEDSDEETANKYINWLRDNHGRWSHEKTIHQREPVQK